MKKEKEFLTLEWFKKTAEKAIKKEVAKQIGDLTGMEKTLSTEKPYKNIKMVNDVLTVVLKDGNVISKPNATEEDFIAARTASSEDNLLALVLSKETDVVKMRSLMKGVELLSNVDDFTVTGGSVYLKGLSRTIPQLLVEQFITVIYNGGEVLTQDEINKNEEFQSLKRFFMWCCLNPRAEVANELYRFLTENSFRITKQGFFVALRNVVTVESAGDNTLVKTVSNAYNKVKAVWKKNPNNYAIVKYGKKDFKLVKESDIGKQELVGNLTKLYLDLPNMQENRFTDAWTKTFDIRVGKVVEMPSEKCNWSTQDCAAAGLHFTADQIHYVGCGDTSVLVLINPMKVVGIGQHKGRCYEYLPIMTVPRDEATQILHDVEFDTLELDESYAVNQLEALEKKVKEGITTETKKHSFNLPYISSSEIKNIVGCLEQMKAECNKRIVTIN